MADVGSTGTGGGKRYAAAEMLAQLLSQYFPEGRDAGDVYWWLSEKYEALPDKEGAKRMYRQLAERHPDHVRVPRSCCISPTMHGMKENGRSVQVT